MHIEHSQENGIGPQSRGTFISLCQQGVGGLTISHFFIEICQSHKKGLKRNKSQFLPKIKGSPICQLNVIFKVFQMISKPTP